MFKLNISGLRLGRNLVANTFSGTFSKPSFRSYSQSLPCRQNQTNFLDKVKELRKRTGAGVGDCKTALDNSKADVEKAIEWLKANRAGIMEKKKNNLTPEGFVAYAQNPSRNIGVLVEMSCETDFVSRTKTFTNTLAKITNAVLETLKAGDDVTLTELDTNSIKQIKVNETETVDNLIASVIGTLKENVILKGGVSLSIPKNMGVVGTYVHRTFDNTIDMGSAAALVAIQSDINGEQRPSLVQLADQMAVQIVGMSPHFITKKELPQEYLQQYITKAKQSGNRIDTIGAVEELVLLEQSWILDDSLSVSKVLSQFADKKKCKVEVKKFVKKVAGSTQSFNIF